MTIPKNIFFCSLFASIIIPLVVPRLIWLAHSRQTMGTFAFAGRGGLGEQLPLSYSVIYFKLGKDTVWFNGLGNLGLPDGQSIAIPVRYNIKNPQDARVDIFAACWGDVLVYGGIPLLILLVIFLQPAVVPHGAWIRLTFGSPFIRIIPPGLP